MVRTRDLILYLTILLFAVIGALYTGTNSVLEQRIRAIIQPDFSESTNDVSEAVLATNILDRDAKKADLRSQLSNATITHADEVAVAVQMPTSTPLTNDEPIIGRVDSYCNGDHAPTLSRAWPPVTTLRESEGLRIVYTSTQSGTSSDPVELLSLPVRQVGIGYTTCLPDTLIGVTPSGQPLYNNSAGYQSFGPGQLVGYARDGYPIYGVLRDTSALDVCGGMFVDGQYRYYVRSDEDFILGCYAGIPSPITFAN